MDILKILSVVLGMVSVQLYVSNTAHAELKVCCWLSVTPGKETE